MHKARILICFTVASLIMACSSSDDSSSTKSTDGVDGTAGSTAADGADGTTGASGQDGADGTDGTDGTDGKAQVDGADGANLDTMKLMKQLQVPKEVTYYNTIEPIMAGRCVRCHSQGKIREQSPLDNYEAVKSLRTLIKDKVSSREMPPYLASDGCRDYVLDERLTQPLIDAIATWADGDAPEGSKDDKAIELPSIDVQSFRQDVKLALPIAYKPTKAPDDYRCFILDWPETKTKYITGFGALPDNYKIVHHIIAFGIPAQHAKEFQAYDDADEGVGYECFGGPTGKGGPASAQGLQWLGGWAPGGEGRRMPAGSGIKVEPGSKIVFQVHYNIAQANEEVDRSTIVFQVEDEVEDPGVIMPWTNFSWLSGDGMLIPAGENDVKHSWSFSVHSAAAFVTGEPFDEPITIWAAALHMHTLGKSGSLFIDRADGTQECLLQQDAYDFNWQRTYGLLKPTVLNVGDKLGIECHWDNSAANQRVVDGKKLDPLDLHWGDGTGDEMCLGIFYMTNAPFSM